MMKILARIGTGVVFAAVVGCVGAQVPDRLSEADARYLLSRTGFAPSPAEVAPWVGLAPEVAVDRLIAQASAAAPRHPAPAFTAEPARVPYGQLPDDEARKAARKQAQDDTRALAVWWLQEMRESPTPLAERMALFWHNHFATSEQKVQQPQGMYAQHLLFRRFALGSFRELLHAVSRDPAMLIWLDGNSNRAKAPNENFAREVMELFTLGEGHYGEQDVREAARAFSGWTVRRATWEAVFVPRQFDSGPKNLFGQTANDTMTTALDRILAQPASARFLVDKLWREFVSPDPEPRAAGRAAAELRASGWQIGAALRVLLLSDTFWAPDTRGTLVKSPVELGVGVLRQFDIALDDIAPLEAFTGRTGQDLFLPPNVKGWPGGTAWIDSTTLLERKRFTERVFRAFENGERAMMASGPRRGRLGKAVLGFDADGWLQPLGAWPDREPDPEAARRIQAAVLAVPAVNPVPAGTVGLSYLRAITLDPAYQLK